MHAPVNRNTRHVCNKTELYQEPLLPTFGVSGTCSNALPVFLDAQTRQDRKTSQVTMSPLSATMSSSFLTGGIPANYRNAQVGSDVSSLSTGGLTNETEFDSVSPPWNFDDLPDLTSVRMSSLVDRISQSDCLHVPAMEGCGTYPLPPLPPVEVSRQTHVPEVCEHGWM